MFICGANRSNRPLICGIVSRTSVVYVAVLSNGYFTTIVVSASCSTVDGKMSRLCGLRLTTEQMMGCRAASVHYENA